jgi:hypothetical protein
MVETLHATCNMPSPLEIGFFLSNFVLLRSIGNCVLQLNPYLMEKIMDLMIYILSPIIISKDFDLLSGLCLNQGFEIFEVLKDLIFFPEKVDPCKT